MKNGEKAETTIKFNVGGKLYEVSKSLLQRFPNTLLTRNAWVDASSTNPTASPIFIDRDPDRFAYCLDYMRDGGRLYLPETIAKSSILQDLHFLGFDDIDESLIDDQAARKGSCARHNDMVLTTHHNVATMQQELENFKMKLRLEKIALICFRKSMESIENEVTVQSPWIYRGEEVENPISSDIEGAEYFCECCDKLGMDVVECHLGFVRFRKHTACAARLAAV
ncbi:unnamed protein product [Cylindrotheca closterium]|uniref:Potassium channel tetramerisation-type BTB domain-containing protein n=1 Tax=Cylindrotheca closterium TaxID=2856 RepID=A0AAD2FWG5_9STRA|nr:unnamed protein product [Cylindrotheca closterium]